MLKIIREQLERLNEISPQIPDVIIAQFNEKFHDQKDVSKPEITNGLDPIQVYVENSETLTPTERIGVKFSLDSKIPPPPISLPPIQGKSPVIVPTQTIKISTPGRTPNT